MLVKVKHPKIEVNKTKKYGEYALQLASKKGYYSIVKLLLGHSDIKINRRDNTALHKSSKHKQVKILQLLLKQPGLKINKKKVLSGNTALHLAVLVGAKEIVALLLKCGADRHIQNSDGLKPIDLVKKGEIFLMLNNHASKA